MKRSLVTAALVATTTLGGCMQPTVVARQPTSNLLQQQDLTLSCDELALRNSRIVARAEELEASSKARARQDAMTNAAVNLGMGMLLGRAASGGVEAMQTASAVGQGVSAVVAAEASQERLQSVTDGTALAVRSAQLQRAMVENGCPQIR